MSRNVTEGEYLNMRNLNDENIYAEVEYINKEIRSHRKGVNLKSIAAEYDFTIEELEEALLQFGYVKVRVKRDYQFIVNDDNLIDSRQVVRQTVTQSKIKASEQIEVIEETPSQKVTEIAVIEKYTGLFTKYETLMKIVEEYEQTQSLNVTDSNLIIELPYEAKTDTRATFRVNDVVYQQFKEFAEKHKQFTVKELISQALLEFIKKYDN